MKLNKLKVPVSFLLAIVVSLLTIFASEVSIHSESDNETNQWIQRAFYSLDLYKVQL